MTQDEKEALLTYLESRLLDLGFVLESNDTETNIIYYAGVYDILDDLDDTLDAYLELSNNGIKNNS